MTTDKPDYEALEALLAEGTERPWSHERVYDMLHGVIIGDDIHGAMGIPDAALIVAAVNNLPALIAKAKEADVLAGQVAGVWEIATRHRDLNVNFAGRTDTFDAGVWAAMTDVIQALAGEATGGAG